MTRASVGRTKSKTSRVRAPAAAVGSSTNCDPPRLLDSRRSRRRRRRRLWSAEWRLAGTGSRRSVTSLPVARRAGRACCCSAEANGRFRLHTRQPNNRTHVGVTERCHSQFTPPHTTRQTDGGNCTSGHCRRKAQGWTLQDR